MEKRVRIFLQSALILLSLGISVQVSAQPEVITQLPGNSGGFITIGEFVYFTIGEELWRTDGTAEGTMVLQTGFSQLRSFREFAGDLYFVNNERELWTSDGSPSGTIRLHVSDGGNLTTLRRTNDELFFQASDPASGFELYRTDGTAAGTMLVKDINPGPANGVGSSSLTTVVGNHLFFAGNNGTEGQELWKSDGTSGGTVMVKDVNPGAANGFTVPGGEGFFVPHVIDYNGLFYFSGTTPESGQEPWVSDGTAEGTFQLGDVVPGAQSAMGLTYAIGHDGVVFFLARSVDSERSTELWKSGGTTASTSKIKFLRFEGHPGEVTRYHSFLVYQDKVYFFIYDGTFDYLWVSDGTSEGTRSIFDLITVENSLHYVDVVNDHILFTGSAESIPISIYRSDGTSAGTEEAIPVRAFGFHYDKWTQTITIRTVNDLAFYADHDGPVNGGGHPKDTADYFHLFQTDGFTTKSMRTLYGVSTLGTDDIVNFNGKVVFTTRNDPAGETTEQLWIYDPASPSGTRASFTLVNGDTDEDIQTINEGDVITKSESSNINIRFNPVETPGSVTFSINGAKARTENAPPYSLAGDTNGDYFIWEGANPGSYTLTATPYSESGGNGTAGTPHTVSFTIEEETATACTASGTILREYWENVPGSRVSDIPLHTAPTSTSQLSIFEGPTDSGTNYGARFSGYICPPATGNYTFWIASNDHSELWLSTDENPANKVRIAFLERATGVRDWDRYASQKSAPVELVAGTRYYIEALHKQGAGTDNLAVGWQLPDGTMERPIPGSRLSPSEGRGNSLPTVTITSPREGETFSSPASLSLNATVTDSDGSIVKVEFFDNSEKLGEDREPSQERLYNYLWENIPPGTHAVTVTATDNSGGVTTAGPVTFTVTGVACTGTGLITRDYWANVPGSRVSDIPVDTPPTSTSEIDIFEGPSNIGTNYASRIRGYVCPPMTGNYRFWIASNDHSELWLNPLGDDPSGRQRIAFVEGATDPRDWKEFASQQSEPIMLEQGKKYYIEALHKQGMGTDHIAVGWMWPNFKTERPIPGDRLSPFDMNDAARMASGIEAETADERSLYSEISIYPNPVPTGNPDLRISGYEGIDEMIETRVEIINLTGEVVYQERIRCGGDCSTYLMNINQQLVPGVYMVNMKTDGIKFSKRLLVK